MEARQLVYPASVRMTRWNQASLGKPDDLTKADKLGDRAHFQLVHDLPAVLFLRRPGDRKVAAVIEAAQVAKDVLCRALDVGRPPTFSPKPWRVHGSGGSARDRCLARRTRGSRHAGVEALYSPATQFACVDFNVPANKRFL